MKACSILIANFEGGEATELCIESLLQRTEYSDYKIVVMDSSLEPSKDKQYLRSQRDRNNIELLESKREHLSHGQALTKLIKHCSTDYACLLDSDCEILTEDWLSVLAELLKEKNDLGVARLRKSGMSPAYYWIAPIFWVCVMFLNVKLYREFEGDDDWSQENIDFSKYRYKNIFKDITTFPKENIVSRDTGWRFTEKVLYETGNRYKIYPIPMNFWDVRIKHYGGISRNYFRPEHPMIAPRWRSIKENLRKLRSEG